MIKGSPPLGNIRPLLSCLVSITSQCISRAKKTRWQMLYPEPSMVIFMSQLQSPFYSQLGCRNCRPPINRILKLLSCYKSWSSNHLQATSHLQMASSITSPEFGLGLLLISRIKFYKYFIPVQLGAILVQRLHTTRSKTFFLGLTLKDLSINLSLNAQSTSKQSMKELLIQVFQHHYQYPHEHGKLFQLISQKAYPSHPVTTAFQWWWTNFLSMPTSYPCLTPLPHFKQLWSI